MTVRSPLRDGAAQRHVAQGIDQLQQTAGILGDGLNSGGFEDVVTVGAGLPQALLDVSADLFLVERRQVIRDAQPPHRVFQPRLRQHALQIGSAGQQDLKKAPGFGVRGRHIDQIIQHGKVEFVGFIDDQDAGARLLQTLFQPLDQGIHVGQRLTVGLVMKQLAAGFLDQVLDGHARPGGDGQDHRAFPLQMVEQFLKQGCLA